MSARRSDPAWRAVLPVALVVLGLGCFDSSGAPPGARCMAPRTVRSVMLEPTRRVDLLVLDDNSSGTAEDQVSLTAAFPRLLSALVTGDRDGDRRLDFAPVEDLHVGIVTSDMGNLGAPVPATCETTFGDDGVLVTRGSPWVAGCAETYPPFLTIGPGTDVARLARDFQCVALVGTGGCGFEQPLEAVLKALTPSTSPIRFALDTTGHADRENAGFARDDSLLAMVVLTDEDDCSVSDPELFDPTSVRYTGELSVRCAVYPDAVQPVSRFVDGLRALRSARPARLVFAVIGGVPLDLVAPSGPTDFVAMLGDERMQSRVSEGGMLMRLAPSCNVPGRGIAMPPQRIVEVAHGLAPWSTVQSMCQDDYASAMDAIAAQIASGLESTCLARSVVADAAGHVACDVLEIMPGAGDVTRCADAPGRTFVRMSSSELGEPLGREVCAVPETPRGAGAGWYYEEGTDAAAACGPATPQRIAFTAGFGRAPGATFRVECMEQVCDG